MLFSQVGGLSFMIEKAHAHQAGDLMVTLDKHDPENSRRGAVSIDDDAIKQAQSISKSIFEIV